MASLITRFKAINKVVGKMVIKLLLVTALLIVLILAGCNQRQLSPEEKHKLDSLDATETVRTYFSSGDERIELYLSTGKEREQRKSPNYMPENERVGGVDDLVVKTGEQEPGQKDRSFSVSYVSHNESIIKEPPGPRMYFVHVIQEPTTKLWKINSVACGP
jgi:hypothetical protein